MESEFEPYLYSEDHLITVEEMIWANIIVDAVENKDCHTVNKYVEKVQAKKARDQEIINNYFATIA